MAFFHPKSFLPHSSRLSTRSSLHSHSAFNAPLQPQPREQGHQTKESASGPAFSPFPGSGGLKRADCEGIGGRGPANPGEKSSEAPSEPTGRGHRPWAGARPPHSGVLHSPRRERHQSWAARPLGPKADAASVTRFGRLGALRPGSYSARSPGSEHTARAPSAAPQPAGPRQPGKADAGAPRGGRAFGPARRGGSGRRRRAEEGGPGEVGSAGRAAGPKAGGLSEEDASAKARGGPGLPVGGGWRRLAGSGPGRDRRPPAAPFAAFPSACSAYRPPSRKQTTRRVASRTAASREASRGPERPPRAPASRAPAPTPPRDRGTRPGARPQPLPPRRGLSTHRSQQGRGPTAGAGSPCASARELRRRARRRGRLGALPASQARRPAARLRGGPRGRAPRAARAGGAAPLRPRATPPHVGALRARGV